MDDNQVSQQIIALKEDVAGMRADIKAAFKRIDEQTKLTETVHKLAVTMEHTVKKLDKLGEDVEGLQLKPAHQWETIVGQVIGLLVAAAAGGVLMKLFGG